MKHLNAQEITELCQMFASEMKAQDVARVLGISDKSAYRHRKINKMRIAGYKAVNTRRQNQADGVTKAKKTKSPKKAKSFEAVNPTTKSSEKTTLKYGNIILHVDKTQKVHIDSKTNTIILG